MTAGGRCLLDGGIGGSRFLQQAGGDNETLGRGSDVVGRIAGDQGQTRFLRWLQNGHIIRLNDALAGDFILEGLTAALDQDFVALLKFLDMPEERVTVPGNDGVTGLSGSRRLSHMARA